MVPEISLTPQTINRFVERFSEEKIAVLHSKLSTGERFDEWTKIKEGKAKIVIGARSAIFAPVSDLGIIIIDEEHDNSYKSEMTPRYSALEIAKYITKEKSIPLVLGSATPGIKTFYEAVGIDYDDKEHEIQLLKMTKRANNATLPDVTVVDMRQELEHGSKNEMLSQQLLDEIRDNLNKKQQTILFLNRRGFSNFLMCKDCGYTVKCKRCDITLTYHKFENKLKCHYCGLEEEVIHKCPKCDSTNISYFGAGTQKLEEEIHNIFEGVSTIRMDVDTVSKKNSHEVILDKFRNDKIDILIGTQMVVKGHDFPNVTLVGVINADVNLNIGDFRAEESTFQTLTQVAGRAGRGEEKGRVIIQTFNPENYAIEYAKIQNYDLFYKTEIKVRKTLKYPPFCDIILIDVSSKDKLELVKLMKFLHIYLKNRVIGEKFPILLYSPVTAPIDKIKDRHRMRIIIKCLYDDRINGLLRDMEKYYNDNYLKKNTRTTSRVIIELNPTNMM